jgi:hypothetical protein
VPEEVTELLLEAEVTDPEVQNGLIVMLGVQSVCDALERQDREEVVAWLEKLAPRDR